MARSHKLKLKVQVKIDQDSRRGLEEQAGSEGCAAGFAIRCWEQHELGQDQSSDKVLRLSDCPK